MKKLIILLTLIFLSQIGFADSELEKQLVNDLIQIKTYEAQFNQNMLDNKGKVLKNYTGQIKLKKPQYFYWRVDEPEKLLVVSNGKLVWNVDEELEQAVQYTLSEEQKGMPIALLTSNFDDIKKEYFVETASSQECDLTKGHCYQMRPKVDKGFDKLVIQISEGKIQFLKVWDAFGYITEYQFQNAKTNHNISTSIFDYKPGKNIDVVIGN